MRRAPRGPSHHVNRCIFAPPRRCIFSPPLTLVKLTPQSGVYFFSLPPDLRLGGEEPYLLVSDFIGREVLPADGSRDLSISVHDVVSREWDDFLFAVLEVGGEGLRRVAVGLDTLGLTEAGTLVLQGFAAADLASLPTFDGINFKSADLDRLITAGHPGTGVRGGRPFGVVNVNWSPNQITHETAGDD
jgi:hypothetical protein